MISKEAQDLIKKMLTKNPDDRISIDDAMKHEWFNSLENEN